MGSDFKDGPRVKDPALLSALHRRWDACVLCPYDSVTDAMGRLSLHHVIPKGSPFFGDDLEENLVMACGSGTTGHHGRVEAADAATCALLGRVLVSDRPDVIAYVHRKLGYLPGSAWLERHLRVESSPWP